MIKYINIVLAIGIGYIAVNAQEICIPGIKGNVYKIGPITAKNFWPNPCSYEVMHEHLPYTSAEEILALQYCAENKNKIKELAREKSNNKSTKWHYEFCGLAILNFYLRGETLNASFIRGYISQREEKFKKTTAIANNKDDSIIATANNNNSIVYATLYGGLCLTPTENATSNIIIKESWSDEFINALCPLVGDNGYNYIQKNVNTMCANNQYRHIVINDNGIIAAATADHIDTFNFTNHTHHIPLLPTYGPVRSLCINDTHAVACIQGTKALVIASQADCDLDNNLTGKSYMFNAEKIVGNTPLIVTKNSSDNETFKANTPVFSCDILFKEESNVVYTYMLPFKTSCDNNYGIYSSYVPTASYIGTIIGKDVSKWETAIKSVLYDIANNEYTPRKNDNINHFEILVAIYLVNKLMHHLNVTSNNIGYTYKKKWDQYLTKKYARKYGPVLHNNCYFYIFANGDIIRDKEYNSYDTDTYTISDAVIEQAIEKNDTAPIEKEINKKFDALNILYNGDDNCMITHQKNIHTKRVEYYGISGYIRSNSPTIIPTNKKVCAYFNEKNLLLQEENNHNMKYAFILENKYIALEKLCEPTIYYNNTSGFYVYVQKGNNLLDHIAPQKYVFKYIFRTNDYYAAITREWLGWSLINPLAWVRGIKSWFAGRQAHK
ncbi:MAG TPA: hypothetical protein VGW78_00310 [Candidatus Babeliales bacterium]|nr:hypothetical protein [Candidatus Babeliales bacterium]